MVAIFLIDGSGHQEINGLRERQMNKAITKNYSTLGAMTAWAWQSSIRGKALGTVQNQQRRLCSLSDLLIV